MLRDFLHRLLLRVSWRARARIAKNVILALDPSGNNDALRQWAAEYVGVDLAHWLPNMPRGHEAM